MYNPFCYFKNILGSPNSILHSVRIFNISVVDVILTLVIARVLQKKVLKNCDYPYFVYVYGTFALGIFFHRLFCVRTTIDKWLFPS